MNVLNPWQARRFLASGTLCTQVPQLEILSSTHTSSRVADICISTRKPSLLRRQTSLYFSFTTLALEFIT